MNQPREGRLNLWRRLSRHTFGRRKISRPIVARFLRAHGTTDLTLLVHPEEASESFPNRYVVSKRPRDRPDLLVDVAYRDLDRIPSESYQVIVCSGLLEHIPDPHRFVEELHRILVPGGRVILTCSCCFSLHEGPNDYFHYTPYGIQVLFQRWNRFEVLKGSCGPFTTIGILLQRILLQCEVFPPLRPVLELLAHGFPRLDRLVGKQFATLTMKPGTEVDSMLPSNLQVVVVK